MHKMLLLFSGIIGKIGNKERRYLHYSCALADYMQLVGVNVIIVFMIPGALSLGVFYAGWPLGGGVWSKNIRYFYARSTATALL